MSFIHPFSQEATSSELDVFKIPHTLTAIESEAYTHFKPVAPVSSGNWIEFRVQGNDHYPDLAQTLLELEVNIVHSDGTALPQAAAAGGAAENLFDKITPVNNFMSSLFQQVDVLLNGTLVTTASNLYHYRAYLDNLLYQSENARKTYLYSSMFMLKWIHQFESDASNAFTRARGCG